MLTVRTTPPSMASTLASNGVTTNLKVMLILHFMAAGLAVLLLRVCGPASNAIATPITALNCFNILFPWAASPPPPSLVCIGGDVSQFQALQELQSAAGGGDLAVRITFYYYTRNYPTYVPYNATLGYVLGVIGVPSAYDTLNVPGERVMSATGNVPEVTYTDPNDLCNGQKLVDYSPWMNDAPFEVDEDQNEVHFDLSNSVPSDLKNVLRSFGTLRLGILMSSSACVFLLGDKAGIPYDSNDQLGITSAIYTISRG